MRWRALWLLGGCAALTAASSPSAGPSASPAATPATVAPSAAAADDEGDNSTAVLIVCILAVVNLLALIGAFFWWYGIRTNPNRNGQRSIEELDQDAQEEPEMRKDPADGHWKAKGAFMAEEGRVEEDWEVAERQVEDGGETEKMPEASLEHVPREALPLETTAFDDTPMKDDYKDMAMEGLRQLRRGEEFHDARERRAREEAEAAKKARSARARRDAYEMVHQSLLAGLNGDEITTAVDSWRDAQADPEADGRGRTGRGGSRLRQSPGRLRPHAEQAGKSPAELPMPPSAIFASSANGAPPRPPPRRGGAGGAGQLLPPSGPSSSPRSRSAGPGSGGRGRSPVLVFAAQTDPNRRASTSVPPLDVPLLANTYH